VYAVEGKKLYICLANPILSETISVVAKSQPEAFICLDTAFEGKDQLKTNAVLELKNLGVVFRTA
jgi:adenine-specific DNA-methyltransferase